MNGKPFLAEPLPSNKSSSTPLIEPSREEKLSKKGSVNKWKSKLMEKIKKN